MTVPFGSGAVSGVPTVTSRPAARAICVAWAMLRPRRPGIEMVLALLTCASAAAASPTVTISTIATIHGTSRRCAGNAPRARRLRVARRSGVLRALGDDLGHDLDRVLVEQRRGAVGRRARRMRIGAVDHAREQQRAGRRQRVGDVGERLAHRRRVGIAVVRVDRADAIDHRLERSELLARDDRLAACAR